MLLRRRVKFPLVVRDVGRQLVPLPLKGVSLVRRRWHVADDSAAHKEARGRGWPRSSSQIGGAIAPAS